MREWVNYYVNVSTTYVWPHGYDNYPCSVRSDKITENTNIEIRTLSFDDVTIAVASGITLDVRARFVKPDKTVITKDLASIDLSSKFSASMLKDKTTSISCFVVDEKINIGEAVAGLAYLVISLAYLVISLAYLVIILVDIW